MKRKRLLFLATAMVMASSLWAQDVMIETDLTSQFNSLATTQWQGASGQVGWAAPEVTTNSGLTVAAWENYCGDWNGGCTNTGVIMHTTVTGLVAGTYKIELYGAAAFTFDRNFGSEAFTGDITVGNGSKSTSDTYKAGQSIDTETGVVLYATTSVDTYEQEIPIWYADNFNGSGLSTAVLNGVVVGKDGKIEIGMSKTSKSTNWHVVQLKGVTATVNARELLEKAVTDANAITGIPTAAKNALDAEVAQYNKSWSSADEYTVAIETIEAVSDWAKTFIEPYADWQSAKANAPGVLEEFVSGLDADVEAATTVVEIYNAIETLNKKIAELEAIQAVVEEYTVMKEYAQNLYDVAEYTENVAGAHDALGTAIEDNSGTYTTPEEYTAATAALKAAATTYAANADPKGEAKFDLTFMLTNPDVTEYWDGTWGIQPEGWYEDQNIDGDNFQVMANNNMGLNGEVFMEYWFWNAATSGYVLYQKVTLPEGAYQMTGRLAVNFDNQPGTVANVTFSANDVDGTQIAAGTLQDASVEFINKEEQEVKIGMKAHEGNQARWMAINKIHLYKIAPKPFEISENETYDYTQSGAGNVELTRTIKEGLNSVVLPFQMSAEDIVILGGEGAVAYTVAGIEGTSLKLAKAESVLANVPFFLKATEAGSEFFFEDKTIVAGEPVATVGVVQAVGTYETITVPTMNNCFVLSNGKFYGVDSEVSLKPTRAYIKVTPAPQDVKVLTIDVEDATAIEAIESAIANTQVYDLSGRKVQSPTRGLYIANGKKILVK